MVSGSMVWCWECGWWLETHLQRVASAFGIIAIYTVRVHNANKNGELDDMHHGAPQHDWHVAHRTPHTRNCCGSTHLCGKSPHVHGLTPLEWSGRSAHVGQVQGGGHLGTLHLGWHWDLEIGCERKVIAAANMTTNTKKK